MTAATKIELTEAEIVVVLAGLEVVRDKAAVPELVDRLAARIAAEAPEVILMAWRHEHPDRVES